MLHIKKNRVYVGLILLAVLFQLTACSAGDTVQTSSVPTIAPTTVTENDSTFGKRAIAEQYWGTWYMAGFQDVTLVISETTYYGPDDYAMHMEFSKFAPKQSFAVRYEAWDSMLEKCGICLEQDRIVIVCDAYRSYEFVREKGNRSILEDHPHLSAIGTWVHPDRSNAKIFVELGCDGTYNKTYTVEFHGFAVGDMDFVSSYFETYPPILLYSSGYFHVGDGDGGGDFWFLIDEDTFTVETKFVDVKMPSVTFLRSKS